MWALAEPWWQRILRAVIVYLFLLLLLRLPRARHVVQLAPFDRVLLLVISHMVPNAMNAGDNAITAGLRWRPRSWC